MWQWRQCSGSGSAVPWQCHGSAAAVHGSGLQVPWQCRGSAVAVAVQEQVTTCRDIDPPPF